MPTEIPLEIDCQTLHQRLEAGEKVTLIDCREQEEYETVCLKQATLIPMSEMEQRVSELNGQEDDELIIHCHHGGRSLRVAMWLRSQGFSKAKSLSGGIDEWATAIDPSLPRY
ncbi:rhodanese-like domain-containing protein [Stratiformator vulcanicus]|uniref:Putative adenylyltransferase/sulfurtransferase MoeZ n=1 Tax=Stratiformator vulcanicus TaxID=2527980 RepID=A0A517R3B6_9PLAN|nr:rhodanese-like domain-containing protein [Stratiformator vulcanicus]QDT38337.1 putative adenylyltransferase/sulfurtransferase MoeZ [Stratiformator vulcanicus]